MIIICIIYGGYCFQVRVFRDAYWTCDPIDWIQPQTTGNMSLLISITSFCVRFELELVNTMYTVLVGITFYQQVTPIIVIFVILFVL